MKKLIVPFIGLLLFLTACQEDEVVLPVDLTVKVITDENYGSLPMGEVSVKIINTTSSQSYSGVSDTEGTITFEALPAGTYQVSATRTLDKVAFEALFGYPSESDEVIFNASESALQVINGIDSATLVMESGKVGDLLIKQIYYAGSNTKEGASFRDQFIEIYNNSNKTIYADGLYIMGAYGKLNTKDSGYDQANGQYDWSQSIGMNAEGDPNTDYFYSKWLYQVPGSGKDYPLEPGESFIIAQNAMNHKAPFVENDGDTVTVQNPDLTVDLSGAEFEVYLGNDLETPYVSDLDNPSVPNLIVHHIYGKDFILDNLGRDSYLIFRAENGISGLSSYPAPNTREVTSSSKLYIQIPKSYIIDGVETQRSPDSILPPKLTTDVDATYTYAPNGGFSSQSVIRKTVSSLGEGGRRVLQDTNNSAEDFTFLEMATPKGFAD
ncbi:DUF4876 domain-containing protein [Limibacter armeniacum]|uniref:DUF4876 domain-containing protein n=1 Tax=Limibacter armeniacum TaxID=466084 RepID=UPI002FE554EB